MLNWIQRFNTFSFLDSHAYPSGLSSQEVLAGAGVRSSFDLSVATGKDAFIKLDEFVTANKGSWIFGHLGYEFGSGTSQPRHQAAGSKGFGDVCFFVPEIVVRINSTELVIFSEDPQNVFDQIFNEAGAATTPAASATVIQNDGSMPNRTNAITIRSQFTQEHYIAVVQKLRDHILRGDCYEINFCQEFYASPVVIDPLIAYQRFSKLSPAPFSAMYRVRDQWLLCASPERYLKKQGHRIYSQPIKGTLKRNTDIVDSPDTAGIELRADEREQMEQLYNSKKDRSENVMIVDLVRNDLSRFCREGSVQVEELFGVYTFPQVYQLISTISGEVDDTVGFGRIISDTFPMGSMTGAPKKKVMELIGKYEDRPRGLYSGTLGYISPEGDFDFNVVIRSILFDSAASHLSMPAGSGITFYSDARSEWEECLTKAAAMRMVFE